MDVISYFLKSVWGIVFLTLILTFLGSLRFESVGASLGSWAGLFFALQALVFMGFAPLLLLILSSKMNLLDFGFRLPSRKKEAIVLIVLAFTVLMPLIIFFSGQDAFQDYYSLKKESLFNFLVLIILPSLIYYFAEEFLFRGFLFWGLWHKIKYHSFWITSLIFSIFHLSKPLPEVFFAFFASLIFCYLSLKTKSFVPAAVAHFLVAIALNALIVFVAGAGGGSGNKFLNF